MATILDACAAGDATGNLPELLSCLKSAVPSVTGRPHQELQQQILTQLDPDTHSLGYLFLLEAQTRSGLNAAGDQAFVDSCSTFLRVCRSAHIRMAPELFAQLCKRYREQVVALGCPRSGVTPLLHAVRKLQPTREHLTPVHADFLQLCILSKMYSAAAEVLADDVYDVDPPKTAITPTDFFLYCYYGGLAAAGRKQYARALELLMGALTAPAVMGNAIVVASFKKLVLISLIHCDTPVTLPRFTPSRVKATCEAESKAYLELASAYGSHSAEKLAKAVDTFTATFVSDNNMGLVKQVMAGLVKRNIQRLTQTYMTLSLDAIATQVSLPSRADAELHVLRMIEAGDIHATINEGDGMVAFLADPEQYNSAAMVARMDAQIRSCVAVAAKLQEVHDAVVTDKAYQSKVSARDRRFETQEELPMGQMFQP
ncbi:hypothetical protein FOA52_003556 [Chlamydomonas sp. UWO 241]|nr:hypothetical protein FOA52_003556 [Chlamydomonas sp. UWO 241]